MVSSIKRKLCVIRYSGCLVGWQSHWCLILDIVAAKALHKLVFLPATGFALFTLHTVHMTIFCDKLVIKMMRLYTMQLSLEIWTAGTNDLVFFKTEIALWGIGNTCKYQLPLALSMFTGLIQDSFIRSLLGHVLYPTRITNHNPSHAWMDLCWVDHSLPFQSLAVSWLLVGIVNRLIANRLDHRLTCDWGNLGIKDHFPKMPNVGFIFITIVPIGWFPWGNPNNFIICSSTFYNVRLSLLNPCLNCRAKIKALLLIIIMEVNYCLQTDRKPFKMSGKSVAIKLRD